MNNSAEICQSLSVLTSVNFDFCETEISQRFPDCLSSCMASHFGWLVLCANYNRETATLWQQNCEVKVVHASHGRHWSWIGKWSVKFGLWVWRRMIKVLKVCLKNSKFWIEMFVGLLLVWREVVHKEIQCYWGSKPQLVGEEGNLYTTAMVRWSAVSTLRSTHPILFLFLSHFTFSVESTPSFCPACFLCQFFQLFWCLKGVRSIV